MAGEFKIFSPAYAALDEKLQGVLQERLGAVIAQTAPAVRAALVLYVLLYGVAILRGAIREPVMDFAVRSVKLAIITALATTPAYGTWVTEPLFHTLPQTLSQALGAGDLGDPGQAFDRFLAHASYVAEKIGREGDITNLMPYVVSGAVYVTGALTAAAGFGGFMVAKAALALILTLGPIFIACALFDASRRFFFGWLSQAVNYLVLMALLLAVIQMVLDLVAAQWGQIDRLDPMVGGVLFIALSLLGAVFFTRTPAIAAGLAGGASEGLADLASLTFTALRRAKDRAQKTGRGS
ncbi:type IV secretion system protein [Phenylobacterium aquaticum]|uniref:type IV secretion system protein n=1 Tax=Phenylobacterium aquaticum TaxID=1763816 RepID=UPI001F5C95BA|nr:type IV secretion system protein [Phenylobacterium aquaticum]MCI3135348.1 type IV secretion system protein [Phenylobacterium aquaticum]